MNLKYNSNHRRTALAVWLGCLCSFAFAKGLPPFNQNNQPAAPDYSNEQYWSALPFRKDAADMFPKKEGWVNDSLKKVDVFYVYPTLYAKGNTWNADVNDKHLNKRLDHLPVRYQASVFNQVGRVYAPRYRQGIINCFFDTTDNGKQALDFAYEDVKRAFRYYLDHYNHGRPIIIASHSQGTTHCRRLIKDFFDTPEKKEQLVAAYIIGYETNQETYSVLTPCEQAEETNCYITWSTFKDGFEYKDHLKYFGNVCVNPVTWKRDTATATTHGGILLNVNKKHFFTTTAHITGHYLSAKTNLTFMKRKDVLHLVDYNLFWWDIRKNVAQRVDAYLKHH